jgi:hypothetical protein
VSVEIHTVRIGKPEGKQVLGPWAGVAAPPKPSTRLAAVRWSPSSTFLQQGQAKSCGKRYSDVTMDERIRGNPFGQEDGRSDIQLCFLGCVSPLRLRGSSPPPWLNSG